MSRSCRGLRCPFIGGLCKYGMLRGEGSRRQDAPRGRRTHRKILHTKSGREQELETHPTAARTPLLQCRLVEESLLRRNLRHAIHPGGGTSLDELWSRQASRPRFGDPPAAPRSRSHGDPQAPAAREVQCISAASPKHILPQDFSGARAFQRLARHGSPSFHRPGLEENSQRPAKVLRDQAHRIRRTPKMSYRCHQETLISSQPNDINHTVCERSNLPTRDDLHSSQTKKDETKKKASRWNAKENHVAIARL